MLSNLLSLRDDTPRLLILSLGKNHTFLILFSFGHGSPLDIGQLLLELVLGRSVAVAGRVQSLQGLLLPIPDLCPQHVRRKGPLLGDQLGLELGFQPRGHGRRAVDIGRGRGRGRVGRLEDLGSGSRMGLETRGGDIGILRGVPPLLLLEVVARGGGRR